MMHANAEQKKEFSLDRRDFMKGSLAALLVPVVMTGRATPARAEVGSGGSFVAGYIEIGSDNTITLYIGQSEMGQGIMTGLAQVMAEELKADWTKIKVVHGAPDKPLYGGQITGGSYSMRSWYSKLSSASAVARERLRSAAADMMSLADPSLITMANGTATYASTTYTYGQLASAASLKTGITTADLTGTKDFIGKRMKRVDIPAKVKGTAVFGIDVRLPNMVYAAVQHCPTIGGTAPATLPATPAGALAVVGLGNAVAVVANDTWSAMKLAEGLKVSWVIPAASTSIDSVNEANISTALINSTDLTKFQTNLEAPYGDPDTALANSTYKIDQTYQLPHLAHACLEPLNCTVNLTSTTCEVWAPTQAPQWVVGTVNSITGIGAALITVNTTFLGGGFGRKIEQDYIAQAVKIAVALKAKGIAKPVKLTWSRKQDFQNDKYRPSAYLRVRAGLDASGNLSSLIYRNVSSSIALAAGNPESTGPVAGMTAYQAPGKGLPYPIANKRIEFAANNVGVPLGYWRSVGESYNIFAIESAIDELAVLAGKTPYNLRAQLLAGKVRELAVLKAASDLATAAGVVPTGSARGLAFVNSFGSIAAIIAEVTVNATTGVLVPKKFFCAIDCGVAVNPDQIEAQVQSAVVMGTTAAMWSEAKFASGKSTLSNYSTYRMLKLKEMPLVQTTIVNSGGPVGGVGETVVPIIAPALANAHAALKGNASRMRKLPFYSGATMGGL